MLNEEKRTKTNQSNTVTKHSDPKTKLRKRGVNINYTLSNK